MLDESKSFLLGYIETKRNFFICTMQRNNNRIKVALYHVEQLD